MNDRFKNVQDSEHNPQDHDCICRGCLEVCSKIAEEMAEKIKKEFNIGVNVNEV